MCLMNDIEAKNCSHRSCLLAKAFPKSFTNYAEIFNRANHIRYIEVLRVPGSGFITPVNPYRQNNNKHFRDMEAFSLIREHFKFQTAGPWPNQNRVEKKNVHARYVEIEIKDDVDGYYTDVKAYALYAEEGEEICL